MGTTLEQTIDQFIRKVVGRRNKTTATNLLKGSAPYTLQSQPTISGLLGKDIKSNDNLVAINDERGFIICLHVLQS